MDGAVIHNFGLLDDYAYPVGNLIIDKSGALYGAVLDSGSLTTAGDPWEAMPSFLE